MSKKITGMEMTGLTEAEILAEMFNESCPSDIDTNLFEYDCPVPEELRDIVEVDCLQCWKESMQREYDLESEEQ